VALIVLDTGAVIGFLDGADAFHAAADAQLRERVGHDRLLASVVTYAELLVGVRLGHHDDTPVRGFFDDLVNELVPVDRDVAERAAELRGDNRGRPKMPDAMVIATAELHADAVITTDDEWPRLGLRCDVVLLTP
jgi:predicted nucleic acid-binding protein